MQRNAGNGPGKLGSFNLLVNGDETELEGKFPEHPPQHDVSHEEEMDLDI